MASLAECAFETERLLAKDWRSLMTDDWDQRSLPAVVQDMLTAEVTRQLPESWQGDYSLERAEAWIVERNDEGAKLLVVEKPTRQAIGLMILSGEQSTAGGQDVRLGYLLSEGYWGRGFASELVSGFVEWSRRSNVASIIGGVARDNVASIRVLTRNGFERVPTDGDATSEDLYRLNLRPEPLS